MMLCEQRMKVATANHELLAYSEPEQNIVIRHKNTCKFIAKTSHMRTICLNAKTAILSLIWAMCLSILHPCKYASK